MLFIVEKSTNKNIVTFNPCNIRDIDSVIQRYLKTFDWKQVGSHFVDNDLIIEVEKV